MFKKTGLCRQCGGSGKQFVSASPFRTKKCSGWGIKIRPKPSTKDNKILSL